MDYDLKGNIIFLKRSADAQQEAAAYKIDDLTYGYSGNRLISVTDSSTDYRGYPEASGNAIAYDEESGNMKSQKDKGILDIKYNYLDLPDYITFDKTYVPRFQTFPGDYNVNTQYLYRADGTKLKKIYTYGVGKANTEESTVTDYLDGFQYETVDSGNLSAAVLKFLPTAEGYYNFENNKYIYSYTDHLGNIRLSYFNNGSGAEVLEENNYYPFGLKHEGYNPTAGNNAYQYKYNGKELQTESGMLDYGWRQYMPELGRWNGMDQLSEKYYPTSPYAYVLNNVINRFDPDGRLSQAQTDYIWNNSGQGVTSWSFNTDGSPKMNSYNYMNDSDAQSLVNSFYGAASGQGSSTINYWTGSPSVSGYISNNELFGNHDFGTLHQLTVRSETNLDWYSPAGKVNWFIGAAGVGVDHFAERFYIGTARADAPVNFLGQNFYGNGRTFIKAAPIAKGIGRFSFFLGVTMDSYGMYEYIKDSNSPNAVHPGKAGLNTVMGYVGLKGGAYGAVISILYFGVDAFYPGGWVGASETAARTEAYEQQMTGHPFFSNSAMKF